MGTRLRVAKRAAGREAVEPRHEDVEDDEVRLVGLGVEELERFESVRGDVHLVALELERARDGAPQGAIVVDDQNPGRRPGLLRPRPHGRYLLLPGHRSRVSQHLKRRLKRA